MKLTVLAVGSKMPAWVQAGVEDYQKRLPRDWPVQLIEVAPGQRGKSTDIKRVKADEAQRLLDKLNSDDLVVALEVKGRSFSTEIMAQKLQAWHDDARRAVFLIGGPDGLDHSCRERADLQWSISELTLPHPLVRIVLVEQLYRCVSILHNHPYHRA